MDKKHKKNWEKAVGNKFRNTGRTWFKKGQRPWNDGLAKGVYGTSFYQVWVNMKTRCYNKKAPDYKRYGGRGIRVCKRWKNSFRNFYEDMYKTHKDGLTLDRVNNNGNYTPENCRWVTRKQQAKNTRNIDRAKKIYYKGIEDTVRNWANYLGIKRTTLDMRFNYGWDIEKVFFTPVRGGGSNQ